MLKELVQITWFYFPSTPTRTKNKHVFQKSICVYITLLKKVWPIGKVMEVANVLVAGGKKIGAISAVLSIELVF